MTYSEFQNVAQDGAERHQVEIESGISKLYANGGVIFDAFDAKLKVEHCRHALPTSECYWCQEVAE